MQSRTHIISLIRQHAELHPRQIAYQEGSNGVTFAELIRRMDEVAGWLITRGSRPGDRCGLMMEEGFGFLVTALGILAAGLCLVPIAITLPAEEVDFVIGAAGLHWLLRTGEKLFHFPFAQAIDGQGDLAYRALDPAYIRFTSGSTGRRKGVLFGHQTIIERLAAANEVLKIGPVDTVWLNLPMVDHFVVSTLLYLSRGATIITAHHPGQWAEAADKATVTYGAPDFYRSLVQSEVKQLPSVRLAISTTAPLPGEVADKFTEKFGLSLNAALGMIELGLLTINFCSEKPKSVGVMMPSYEATILDQDGHPAAPNTIGELQIKGQGLLDAYIAPWRPRKALLGIYGFPTGDYAKFDEEGYLFLVGRGKNRLEVAGIEFFCEEVESILNQLPGIEESRVFIKEGILSAQVTGSIGSTANVPALLETLIDQRKIPRQFSIVQQLPRTPNGKLRR